MHGDHIFQDYNQKYRKKEWKSFVF